MPSISPFLTIDRVTKTYPTANGIPANILDGIDLTVAEGEFIWSFRLW
jgi:ABC-type oligopeptide transport system ATPase subunit